MSLTVEGAHARADESGAGERALALAVLDRALIDAKTDYGREGMLAKMFLTATEGAWAKSRYLWCDRANIAREYFDRHVRQVLA